ncbi:MAG: MopE-related protein [Ferruginibacter sp.]
MKKIILLLCMMLSAFFVHAQTWDGSASTDWNDPQNWTPASVPLATGNVTINTAPNVPSLPANTTVNSFGMNAGSSINFNGFNLNINGNMDINGATLTNSNGGTDINITFSGTSSQYIRNSTVSDNIILNHAGTGQFYEAYQGGNTFNGNTTFNITTASGVHICYQNKSTFSGNVTVNRMVAGSTEIFENGFNSISGNLAYTNNVGGISYINGSGIASGPVSGTVNITLSGGGNFSLRGIKNNTTGGTISVQDPTLAFVKNDTLLLSAFTITGITGSGTDDFEQNEITATVTIADAVTNTGNYYFRSSVVNGNTTFTTNADFYEGYQGGNTFNGNTTFNVTNNNVFYVCYQNKSTFSGNVTVNRSVAGSSEIFYSGFNSIGGNFAYTNNVGGISYINGSGIASGLVSGTVNITLSGGGNFSLRGIKNNTTGGTISVQDPTLAFVKNDTLLLNALTITGITGSGTDDFEQNNISATVTLADATSNTGNFYFRSSVINGNTTFTTNADFYEGYQGGNTFNGNTTFNITSGNPFHGCYQNKSTFLGNLTVNRSVAGSTEIFQDGFNSVSGNFAYTNNAGGISYINGSGIASGPVGGTVNIILSGGGNFSLRGIKNNTTGGSISVQDPTLAFVKNDTLLLNSFSITGITGSGTDDFEQNSFTGTVTISTAAANTGNTYLRGNLFNDDVAFTNNASANVYESYTQTDEYRGNVTFVQANPANQFNLAYGAPTLFHRNLTINSTANLFAIDSLTFVGNTNTIFDQLGTQVFAFTRSVINKTGGATVTLNDRVLASGHMRFANGYLVTSQAAPVCFTDGASHAGSGNSSHVNGVVQKLGNDAFTFPVGDGATLKPVSITAPNVVTDLFSVRYFNDNPSLAGYDTSAHAGTLLRISGYEYWDVRREAGTSNEDFTFSYTDPGNNQYITNPSNARIAHWTGSTWADNGNIASTGTTSGTVTATLSNFTQTFFTFGSTNLTDNPLLDVTIYTYYADTDNDNFGDLNNTTTSTSQTPPAGYVADNTDCNDGDNTVYPGAPELCDNKDNDCDGTIDDGVVPPTFYRDFDNDGFGDASNTQQACTAPVGYVSNDDDCDDNDNTVYPNAPELCDGKDNDCDGTTDEGVGTTFYRDLDNDGFGDANNSQVACSAPVGYVSNDDDCDDNDNTVYPNAPELCDGKDNDCDGTTDEGVGTTFYRDLDNDGFGDATNSQVACSAPVGYVSNDDDCDDNDNTVYPNAPELCDNKDNDCDGTIDDGAGTTPYYADADADGFGDPNVSVTGCTVPPGYVSNDDDCDDNDNTVYPNAPELCDGKDNDCDGTIDDGAGTTFYRDFDNDGFGDANNSQVACSAPVGYVSNDDDCDDNDNTVYPNAPELCDGKDNDCDGTTDEGAGTTFYRDFDNDGFGDANNSQVACSAPVGYVSNDDDCDDNDNTVYPNAPELCDGKDNDCDGTTDEGAGTTFYRDFDNDGFGDANNSQIACSAPVGYVINDDDCDDNDNTVYPNAPELCDGKDNDCDGTIDDGAGTTPYYADADGDGFGDPNVSVTGCIIPPGYVNNDDDCDDNDNTVYPNAPELCDGKDNNCDGNIDEGVQSVFFADADGDGFGNIDDTTHSCFAPVGYVLDNTDCNDADNTIYPGAPELCDGKDNNCDGSVDEGIQTVFYADDDGDGYGNLNDTLHRCVAPAGYVLDNTDCDDTEGSVNPGATEILDGIDNNCNGLVDEGVLFTFYLDSDNDGFGDPNNSVSAAIAPPGYISDNTDCDDADNTVYPGAPEICDGKDNDCDGTIDGAVSTPVITGPTNMCPYEGTGQQVIFTIDPLPGVTGYQWTVPSTVNIVSGPNTNTLTVTILAGFATNANKQIRVTTTSVCGTSPVGIHYLLAQFPSTPGFITGPVEACSFVGTNNEAEYRINKVIGATSYIWTVSAGMTISNHPGGNGINDTIIRVLYGPAFTGGTITVRAANNCGTSVNVRQLAIVNGITATPGLIQEPANACLYMPSAAIPAGVPATYTIRKVLNATSYTWTVPVNASATHPEGPGVNDTVIIVTYSGAFAGGNITVAANGSCASSGVRSLAIQVNLKPGTIAAISANETQSCPNRQVTYSITLPSSTNWVEWTVPAGATILSGQGTASIIVSYPSASTGSVTATPSNGCGVGKTRTLQVSILACRPLTNFAKGTVQQPALKQVPFDVQVYPNPAQSEFNISIAGKSNEKVTIRIYDVNGKRYLPEVTGPNTISHFGNNLKPGIYMVEVTQGDNKKVTRVIKL